MTVKEFDITQGTELPLSLFPDTWKAEYNGIVKDVKAEKGIIDLGKHFGSRPEKTEAILTGSFSSEKSGILRVGISADWWMEFFANGNPLFSSMQRGNESPLSPKSHFVEIPVSRGETTLRIRVLSGSKGWKFIYGEPMKIIVPEYAENCWRDSVPIKNTVRKGSALDLSGIVPAERSGTRIIYSPVTGGYAYEDDPATPIHFFSAEALPSEIFYGRILIKSDEHAKKELDLWAQSLKRRGYSSIRMHTLDRQVCYHSKEDMQVDSRTFDRIMYAFSCLKREGIRLHLTILSYGMYSYKNRTSNDHLQHKVAFLFLNDSECERFRFGAEKLLTTVNPYTGKRLIDDPLLVSIELFNEM